MGKGKVFIVHGHDNELKYSVSDFLRTEGFEPLILHEQVNKGQTVIEKFEKNSDAVYAVVLYTPDDAGGTVGEKSYPRARQNVVFEHGFFLGRLGRKNVALLYEPSVELPGDISGTVYININKNWRDELKKELDAIVPLNRKMANEVDASKYVWNKKYCCYCTKDGRNILLCPDCLSRGKETCLQIPPPYEEKMRCPSKKCGWEIFNPDCNTETSHAFSN